MLGFFCLSKLMSTIIKITETLKFYFSFIFLNCQEALSLYTCLQVLILNKNEGLIIKKRDKVNVLYTEVD